VSGADLGDVRRVREAGDEDDGEVARHHGASLR
jgi:hypothetical protein